MLNHEFDSIYINFNEQLFSKGNWKLKLKKFLLPQDKVYINKKTKMWSQIGQDFIADKILNHKRNGFFVEVGGYHPFLYSNSYFFESNLAWDGIIFEINKECCKLIKNKRKCLTIESDILKVDQKSLESYLPKRVDFLSIDIEPNLGNLIALKKFINLPVRYSFLTFEHSEGRENSKNQKIQDKGFQMLTAKNYYRIAKDVLLNNLSTEDWYIDLQAEEFLNTKVINALKESSNVEYLELTDIAKKNFLNKK